MNFIEEPNISFRLKISDLIKSTSFHSNFLSNIRHNKSVHLFALGDREKISMSRFGRSSDEFQTHYYHLQYYIIFSTISTDWVWFQNYVHDPRNSTRSFQKYIALLGFNLNIAKYGKKVETHFYEKKKGNFEKNNAIFRKATKSSKVSLWVISSISLEQKEITDWKFLLMNLQKCIFFVDTRNFHFV